MTRGSTPLATSGFISREQESPHRGRMKCFQFAVSTNVSIKLIKRHLVGHQLMASLLERLFRFRKRHQWCYLQSFDSIAMKESHLRLLTVHLAVV